MQSSRPSGFVIIPQSHRQQVKKLNYDFNLLHRVQRSCMWINKLNVYTCRLARLISPMGSLWIYCEGFLCFLPYPDRLCCSSFWKSITTSHSLASARHVARRATKAREPSVSWFAVYRMCNETVTRSGERDLQRDQNNPSFQMFSTSFDVLTTNTSPLDPVLSVDSNSYSYL